MSNYSDLTFTASNYSARILLREAAVDPTHTFGEQRDSLFIVIPITIIYVIIFITGLFGNLITCAVIVRNKIMHTATNYYLFSLAISDLLLLVSGMPQEMYSIWSKWPYIFGHTFCVIRGLAAETSTNASILTITLFTIERYLAICHPFVSHKMSKLSRAVKHVVLLWVASFGLALPQALQFGIRIVNGVTMCLQTRVIIEHSFEISTFLFFFAPMMLITILYCLIGLRLKKSDLKQQTVVEEELERSLHLSYSIHRKHNQSTRRVVKMLVAVVTTFFMCWAPFHAQRLVAIYGTEDNHSAKSPALLFVYYIMTYTSGVFYYISTCINPILYHVMSNKFREAFKNTVRQLCCRRGKQNAIQRCSYTAVGYSRRHNTNGTNNSGNSSRNEVPTRQLVGGDGSNEYQSRVCNACSKQPYFGQTCRSRSCSQLSNETFKKTLNDDSKQSQIEKYIPSGGKRETMCSKRSFSAPSCCCSQNSNEAIESAIPELIASANENKTEHYPVNSIKITNEVNKKNIVVDFHEQ